MALRTTPTVRYLPPSQVGCKQGLDVWQFSDLPLLLAVKYVHLFVSLKNFLNIFITLYKYSVTSLSPLNEYFSCLTS